MAKKLLHVDTIRACQLHVMAALTWPDEWSSCHSRSSHLEGDAFSSRYKLFSIVG